MPFYDYHPASTAKLGFPIDPRRPYDDKTTGGYIKWTDLTNDISPMGAEVSFKIKEASSRRQLYEMMSLDISVEAKFNLFSAKSSLNFEQESSFDEKTLVYVVTGKKIYLPQSILGTLEFSTKGVNAWKRVNSISKVQAFQKTVGTEVVTKIQKGNTVSLIYSFQCSSSSFRQKIKASLDVGWSTGSVSVDFGRELMSIDESMNIVVEGFQSGVTDNELDPRLSDIIKEKPGDIVAIKRIISDILGNVSESDRDASPIISYNTTHLSDISNIAESAYADEYDAIVMLNSNIDKVCLTLNEMNIRNFNETEKTRRLEQAWNTNDFVVGSLTLISNKINDLIKQSMDILNAYSKLTTAIKPADLAVNISTVLPLNYSDVLLLPIVIPLSWQSRTDAWETSSEHGTFRTQMWPVIHIKFQYAIKLMYVVLNGTRLKVLIKDMINKIISDNGSFEKVWTLIQQDYGFYIWGWRPDLVEAQKPRSNDSHRKRYEGQEYFLEVVLEDGSTNTISIASPAGRIRLSRSHFANMSPELITGSFFEENPYWELEKASKTTLIIDGTIPKRKNAKKKRV